MTIGPLMVDIDGLELTAEDRDILNHPMVGGLILFSRNFTSVEQVENLITSIRSTRKHPLLIAVDHEGGRVQRFREGFTKLPPLRGLGELYDRDQTQALSIAEQFGWLIGTEVRAIDADLAFAPVLDQDRANSEIIGNRAFHESPELITELGTAFMKGMDAAGMACTGKHFPGHGGVSGDSHLMLPEDARNWETLLAEDMQPFAELIRRGLPSIMMAHVVYPVIDTAPAGFSRRWVTDILRQKLRFDGVIFSDDLSMAGAEVAGGYIERAEAALEAGSDMALVCNNRAGAIEVLDGLQWNHPTICSDRLMRLIGRSPYDHKKLADAQQHPHWLTAVNAVQSLA